jgi:hypothetical protein
MGLRRARAELNKLKETVKGPAAPHDRIIMFYSDRETPEQAAERLGIDPETEGLVYIGITDADAALA